VQIYQRTLLKNCTQHAILSTYNSLEKSPKIVHSNSVLQAKWLTTEIPIKIDRKRFPKQFLGR